jgi:hypothetical protein
MEKLPQVEQAKALMNEAVTWSVMKWLREKKRVRATADQANAVLDALRQRVQQRWPEEQQAEYEAHAKRSTDGSQGNSGLSGQLQRVHDADRQAMAARVDAEKTFNDAEKQLSPRLAREGCQKAIRSWELHEKAIQTAELLIR